MRAALVLRLVEARRRGGWILLGLGLLVVGWVGVAGGETPDGRYGLATDLAATFTYLAAMFYGAFPLAADREHKRSYLPGASPVSPWAWALGNAAGAALIGLVAGLALFWAAGAGAALGGGIETHGTTRIGLRGTAYLPLPPIRVPKEATHIRLVPRVYLSVDEAVGTTDSATVEVDGKPYEFFPNQPIVVPISSELVFLRNLSEEHAVGIALEEVRALVEERSFLANASAAGVAPALGAAALAAFGAAAGANLSAPIAALLAALVLVLASLKGFLTETFEYEGRVQQAKLEGDQARHDHEHEAPAAGPATHASRAIVKGLLYLLPDLSGLDRTDRVAIGEWTGLERSGGALLLLGAALLLAGALGGVGVHARRLP